MDKKFLDFKSSDINYRIALWDPKHNGLRYLKTLIYNLAFDLSKDSQKKLFKIKNREIGKPITIKHKELEVCLDYLQAIFELEFIEKNLGKRKNLSILEIGAGYGRTCHTLLSNFSVKDYAIIEFNNYKLVHDYLKSVLKNKDFKKISFFKFPNMPNRKFDICINIDSFGEMPENLIHKFTKFIDKQCIYFYTKNTVGKYLEKELDNHFRGKTQVNKAIKTGLMLKIIDIFDEKNVEKNRGEFLVKYCPSLQWECIADSWAKPFSHYWQAMYRKN